MGEQWTEVNIAPASLDTAEQELLLDVVRPLVLETLPGWAAAWFFAWEVAPVARPHLRLRIMWEQQDALGKTMLRRVLDAAEQTGRVAFWWPGAHGIPGEQYAGEEAEWGELWPQVLANWQAGSELALAVIAKDPDRFATQLRYDHWSRRLHMFSNELRLGYFYEGYWSLAQAASYLRLAVELGSPAANELKGTIGTVCGAFEDLDGQLRLLPREKRRG